MITTEQIRAYFNSLVEFECFRLRWIRACAVLNENSRNAENLEVMERRAKKIGI